MKTNKNYSHKELAALYFPNVLPESASTQLSRWMRRDEELWADLLHAGYHKKQRLYTPRQVQILVDHLGDPETWNIK